MFTISFNVQLGVGTNLRTAIAALRSSATIPAQAPPLPFGNIAQNGTEPITALESHWLTTKNGVQSLFNRVRILQGSMVIVDILDYNKLNRILKFYNLTRDHVRSSDFINEGIYDQDDWLQKRLARNFYASPVATNNTGQYWNVRLNTGFMEIDKYFPVKYTGQITIELYLEQNTFCLCSSVVGAFSDGNMPSSPISPTVPTGTTGTANIDPSVNNLSYPNPTYQITDVQAHVHFVVPIEDYDDEMLRTINEEGLTVMYSTWNQHTRQITSPGSQVVSFQERSTSVRGGVCVMENNVDIGDIRNPDYQFSANNLQRFQWKMGNLYIPSQPVECESGVGRALFELENFLGVVGNMQSGSLTEQKNFLTTYANKSTANAVGTQTVSTTGTIVLAVGSNLAANTANRTYENFVEMRYGNSLPTKFVFPLNLDKSPGQLSGFNTSATNVDIELRFTLDTQSALANMPPPQSSAFVYNETAAGALTALSTFTVSRATTWAINQGLNIANGNHIFQPSKFKCHDTTSFGDAVATNNRGFYALTSSTGAITGPTALGDLGGQPDNQVFNGEGFSLPFYTAGEAAFPISTGANPVDGALGNGAVFPKGASLYGGITGGFSQRAINRFPDSGQASVTTTLSGTAAQAVYVSGIGEYTGGVTSTSFMYTKAPATSVLLTMYAYIDAQVSIMKVGQLEVLR